jgi:hypothetical protein
MTDSIKKRVLKLIIAFLIIIIILALPFIISMTSPYTVIITNTSAKYFMVKYMLISGNYLFCLKDSNEYNKRKDALAALAALAMRANSAHNYSFAYILMSDIANMEIIPGKEETSIAGSSSIEIKYFGKYKIDVSGYVGFLFLGMKNGKVYGSLRFPDWGNGAFEPIKNPWISKGKIGFIRSVETREEAKRVGSPGYFTQEFHGEYKDGGNVIQGFYLNRGANMMWRAFKLK